MIIENRLLYYVIIFVFFYILILTVQFLGHVKNTGMSLL